MSTSSNPDATTAAGRLVEDLAMLLAGAGVPRMPARVYAYLVVDDAGPRTAGELAAGLQVSPAAVSGAVRHLVQIGVVDKAREPGANADSYELRDDASDVLMRELDHALRRADSIVASGIETLETTGRMAGPKLTEVRDYGRFWVSELPGLIDRWQARRGLTQAERTPSPGRPA